MNKEEGMEQEQKQVIDFMSSHTEKHSFTVDDFMTVLPGQAPDAIKRILNSLVEAGKLEFWTEQSSLRYALQGAVELT